ncbi:hypothetical protein [Actinoplanes aureus]|uniref:PKD domain-containing protein n=1 Tax=Actinoplanes aureus TaxID=2792083 RepID=A0A931C6I5_9ACTN|nr:hypothetical protein [Actinoplanes aureus]MBG0561562.1 hypothetical protein [Actinoplanes aureus]
MNPRLSRPLLAALVSGALVAGGAIYTSPASAGTPLKAPVATESDTPVPPSDAPPSVAPPSVAPPSVAPPSDAPPSVAPPSVAPPSVAPPSVAPPSVVPSSGNPSTPDTIKPTGSFKLNLASIWIGQSVAFSQTTVTDNAGAANVARTINWGDGTTTVLAAGVNVATKTYTRAGKFTVTELLVDKANNSTTLTGPVVSVVVPGKFSLSKSTVYQGVPFNVNVSKLPVGTTSFRVDWGDGTYSGHKAKNGAVTGFILYFEGNPANSKISGKRVVRVRLFNKNGGSSYINAGTINVLRDPYLPLLKITKPSKPSKVSSWRTVRGTASDKHSGLFEVGATAIRVVNGKTYCMTSKTKWKRYTTDNSFNKNCKYFKVKVTKGKWSLKLPSGLTKGHIVVSAYAVDFADNSTVKVRQAKLTS